MSCKPDELFSKQIKEVLDQGEFNFPFEYYMINFATFSGEPYIGYRKYLRHIY